VKGGNVSSNGFTSLKRSAEHGFTFLKRSAEHGFMSLRRSAEHGFTSLKRSAEHGFTLVELMIALFIFAMLASAGVGLLGFSTRAQAVTAERLGEAASEHRLSAILASDLAQAQPRVSRDETGARSVAFEGGQGPLLLRYVRAGWLGGDGRSRSALQGVEWRFDQRQLLRVSRPMVDGAADIKPVIMAGEIERVALRFRKDGVWQSNWAPATATELPQAVELIITPRGKPAVTRLFLVGTGY
jgi:general secretion pathway protein J